MLFCRPIDTKSYFRYYQVLSFVCHDPIHTHLLTSEQRLLYCHPNTKSNNKDYHKISKTFLNCSAVEMIICWQLKCRPSDHLPSYTCLSLGFNATSILVMNINNGLFICITDTPISCIRISIVFRITHRMNFPRLI